MEKVVPVDEQTLVIINEKLKDVDVAVSSCMSYIRRVQDIPFNQLSARCSGVSGIMWKRYMQPSYHKMRPLHVVAAYSWLTMVPMPSFYRGLAIKESYRGMDEEAVAAMIHCGILPKKQYNLLLEH
ncbi:MAG: hypothetical protein MK076_11655, partial [Flavobacteriales bacterium]|nr:hypothetical protein [Flavobacteriales bacterium]